VTVTGRDVTSGGTPAPFDTRTETTMNETVQSNVSETKQSDQGAQQSLQQAVRFPLEQMIQFQRGATELFLSGLEVGTEAQNRSVQLTKEVLDSYLRILERAALDTEELTRTGFNQLQAQENMWERQSQQAISRATQPLQQYQGQMAQTAQGAQTNPYAGQSRMGTQQGVLGQTGIQQQPTQQYPAQQQFGRQQFPAQQEQYGQQPRMSQGMQSGQGRMAQAGQQSVRQQTSTSQGSIGESQVMQGGSGSTTEQRPEPQQ
jgi:hypothetical protein